MLVLVVPACTEGPPTKTAVDAPRPIEPPPKGIECALGVDGTVVVYAETAAGARLSFLAPPPAQADLRERARDAAAWHGPGSHLGKGHEGRHGMGGQHGLQIAQLPPASLVESDIEGGAVIDFTAGDARDTAALRAKVSARAAEMNDVCRGRVAHGASTRL